MTTNKIVKEDLQAIFESGLDWNRFTNKTILITGASGFLAAYLVQSLLFANEQQPGLNIKVIALVRNLYKAKIKFVDYLEDNALQFLEQDVCTPVSIAGKIDYIIHAASQASPKFYGTDPVGTLSANVLGTLNLLELARKQEVVSFLYFSSGEVYGQVESRQNPVKEDFYGYLNPMLVRSCYGESKRMGENICVSYWHQYNVKTKVVRPFHTYGPGMDVNDGRVYADFVSDALSERSIEMKSDGTARRAFCYLKDATIAFFTVLLSGENGQAYNVGNPVEEYSILELAQIVATSGKKQLQIVQLPGSDNNAYLKSPVPRNTPDITKISLLGWVPETSASIGFKRTIESY